MLPTALPPPSCTRPGPHGEHRGVRGGGSVGTGEALGGPQGCEARERKRGAAPPQVAGPEGGEPGPGPLWRPRPLLAAGARGPLKVAAPELGPALGGSRRAPGAREGREPRPKGPRGNPLVAFSFYRTPLRLPRVKRCRCGGCERLCARGVPPVFVTALPPLPPPSLSSSPWKSLYRVLKVLLFFFPSLSPCSVLPSRPQRLLIIYL